MILRADAFNRQLYLVTYAQISAQRPMHLLQIVRSAGVDIGFLWSADAQLHHLRLPAAVNVSCSKRKARQIVGGFRSAVIVIR